MGILPQPRDLAELTEIDPAVPAGRGDRFSGYGVMGLPFASGHVLTLRRFPASSLGYGYSSVWHRTPAGAWTFWSDNSPDASCARFFAGAAERVGVAPIRVSWPGARRLRVVVGRGIIDWSIELVATPATHLLNLVGDLLPSATWRHPGVLEVIGRATGQLLGAGRVSLTGRAPNGQRFTARPLRVWQVRASCATVEGVQLGPPGPLATQAMLGDFAIPQRGLFVIGQAYFEDCQASRHSGEVYRAASSGRLSDR